MSRRLISFIFSQHDACEPSEWFIQQSRKLLRLTIEIILKSKIEMKLGSNSSKHVLNSKGHAYI